MNMIARTAGFLPTGTADPGQAASALTPRGASRSGPPEAATVFAHVDSPATPPPAKPAPGQPDATAEDALQQRLSALNRARLQPAFPADAATHDAATSPAALAEEWRFLEAARARVIPRAAAAPTDPAAFLVWFEVLADTGPGQHDPLFPWLATRATLPQMRWFLAQEVAGEAGFDDLTALTLLRMPARPKLELARNFWDEMGRGNPRGMHGPMLDALAAHLHLADDPAPPVWQSLALANTMAGLAARRCTAYQSIGALGVVELTAPGRAAQVAAGLKRLGVPARVRHYFDLHAVLDIRHSAAWNAEVIAPLVALSPAIATAIAEGALMRLACGAACFARYRQVLEGKEDWGDVPSPQTPVDL